MAGLALGARCIRGPDWQWDDQDGGQGRQAECELVLALALQRFILNITGTAGRFRYLFWTPYCTIPNLSFTIIKKCNGSKYVEFGSGSWILAQFLCFQFVKKLLNTAYLEGKKCPFKKIVEKNYHKKVQVCEVWINLKLFAFILTYFFLCGSGYESGSNLFLDTYTQYRYLPTTVQHWYLRLRRPLPDDL